MGTPKPKTPKVTAFNWKNGWMAKPQDIDDVLQSQWAVCYKDGVKGKKIKTSKHKMLENMGEALKKVKSQMDKEKKKKMKDIKKDNDLKKAMLWFQACLKKKVS